MVLPRRVPRSFRSGADTKAPALTRAEQELVDLQNLYDRVRPTFDGRYISDYFDAILGVLDSRRRSLIYPFSNGLLLTRVVFLIGCRDVDGRHLDSLGFATNFNVWSLDIIRG
jgi:hypothetical protein